MNILYFQVQQIFANYNNHQRNVLFHLIAARILPTHAVNKPGKNTAPFFENSSIFFWVNGNIILIFQVFVIKSRIIFITASGCSAQRICPALAIVLKLALGIKSAVDFTKAGGVAPS